MNSREDVMKLLGGLADSAWALSTVSAAFDAGILDLLGEPHTEAEIASRARLPAALLRPCLDTLVALGLARRDGERFVAAPGLQPFLAPPWRAWLEADLRATLGQSRALSDGARAANLELGWRFTDTDILQAQGGYSEAQFDVMDRVLLPQLAGLREAFAAPGAALLDVGAGVAGICIALCRRYPALRAVGLEPAPAPLALARGNVAAAGLADRIELRQTLVQELDERDAYDLAWLPQMFLPDDVFATGLAAVARALRPGGWLLTASVSHPDADLGASLSRVRNAMFGGGRRYAQELVERLGASGLVDVRTVPTPARLVVPVVGRRPI